MDGDECPLREIVSLSIQHDAAIILDEAHSTGVRGSRGAGCSVEQNLHDKVDIRVYTFGKGMGVHGACVAGSETLIRYLINFARPFIYTTALSPHSVAAISCAFELLANKIGLQQTLQSKIDLYLQRAEQIPNRTASHSAIQTILVPGIDKVRNAAAALQQKGFDVRPILYPTVPEGTERLRICLHTFNTDDEIVSLMDSLVSLT
jgi:8-amino-7-oxononanoate synthase